jgi:hypothetical protein
MARKKEVKPKKNTEESKETEVKKETERTETKKEIENNKEIEKPKELSLKQKQNRQIIWALVLMASIIIIIFLVPYIKQNVFNKFEYIGLDFYKTKTTSGITGAAIDKGIIFYFTKIPLVNQYAFPIGDYSIYFRNNPKELGNISVDIIEKKIEFQKDNIVYISIQYDAPVCEDNIVAVVGLTNFLDKFGNLKVKGAMNDAVYASNNNLDYITCKTNPNNTVILLKTGNETIISKTGRNCYELQYKECEIDKVTEKFILTIMENYMEKYNELDIKE